MSLSQDEKRPQEKEPPEASSASGDGKHIPASNKSAIDPSIESELLQAVGKLHDQVESSSESERAGSSKQPETIQEIQHLLDSFVKRTPRETQTSPLHSDLEDERAASPTGEDNNAESSNPSTGSSPPQNAGVREQINFVEQEAKSFLIDKERDQGTAYEKCLRALLIEMKWPGEERHIMQAMPHFKELNNSLVLRGVIHHLGFETAVMQISDGLLVNRLPCLLIDDENAPKVALRLATNGKLVVFDGNSGKTSEENYAGRQFQICAIIKRESEQNQPRARKTSWFFDSFLKFKSKIWLVVALTFVANLLGLATPVFTMNVYNHVIESKSLDTLAFFLGAILATLGFELYLRNVRGRLIAYVGSRFNTQLLIEGFKRILGLPISMTESASVSQQIVRLRQFENVQTFFTGPLVSAVLDVPFTLVFVLAIGLIHPVLAAIPVVLALVFAIIGILSMPATKRNVTTTGKVRQIQQNLLIETVHKRETIRHISGEDIWIKRWNDIGNDFNQKRFNAQFFDTIMHTLSQSLVMIAGIATLWVGAILVMDEALSVGALIAVMMFVWRILSPIQTAFLSLNRVGQFIETAKQTDLLMSVPLENHAREAPTLRRNYLGEIVFSNVSFRYGYTGDPVFRGINMEIPAGQVVAITGDAASGSSTFLKLIMGLYRPQTGNVYIDGLNLQQLDLDEVRTSIGYVAERQDFFYGTLAQNIRLASPSASDKEIEETLGRVGIWLPHPQLEEGINTRLTSHKLSIMPNPLKQAISLARAFVKRDAIYLLDGPNNYLNEFEEKELLDHIDSLRGKSTVVIATTDDQLIAHCDRVIFLRNGGVVFDDTPEVFLKAKQMAKLA